MNRKYTAYFDESGDDRLKVFAGFVAANEQWERFEDEWVAVLRRFSAPPLHMRTFAHCRDEFSEWKGDEARRVAFLKSLIAVIKLRTRTPFASAVIVDHFDDVAARCPELLANHTAFSIAGNSSLVKVARWAERYGIPSADVTVLFEDGAGEKKSFVRHAKEHLHFTPTFAPKKAFAAFQAADLFAFEYLLSNRAVYAAQDEGRDQLGFSELRRPLQALLEGQPKSAECQWGIYEKSTLERSCVENGWHLKRAQN